MQRTGRALAVLTAATAMTAVMATSVSAAPPTDSERLRSAVTAKKIVDHLEEFQKIADNDGGTRAGGTPGYDASLDHLEEVLTKAGYEVTRQDFRFNSFRELSDPVFERTAPTPRTYTQVTTDPAVGAFAPADYSGTGDVTATVRAVDVTLPPTPEPSSTSGCEAEDFAGFTAGSIALVQRGTCDFSVKAQNAVAAGAVGVIIFNEGQPGRTEALQATLGDQFALAVPVIGTSFEVGNELAGLPGAVVRLATDTEIRRDVPTQNLIAETPTGDDEQVVMAGAHLDSVAEGPGINDNGSGSAALLEIALQMSKREVEPLNTVRFAWWGAEEAGLIGSQAYVDSLVAEGRAEDVGLYLNLDMIGSPNYARFVYDGDGSEFGVPGPEGSADIEALFTSYFAAQGLASEPTEFDGRSDYDAFVAAGIPAGGLFTGAEDVKTEEQAARYGGVAGEAFDPCYHQACDSLDPIGDGAAAELYRSLDDAYDRALRVRGTISNVNTTALEEMSDATAHAILTYAMSDDLVEAPAVP